MSVEYWEERARGEYTYKGEKFYTISAIPYYIERRSIIVSLLKKEAKEANRIVDIGCGDGEYLYFINEKMKHYCGVDISEEMLDLARKRCRILENVCFECSNDGVHKFLNYDMAYIVAVLAHIDDESMNKIIGNIAEQMHYNANGKGKLCICEQIAPYEIKGLNYKRRTITQYVKALEQAGFTCEQKDIMRIDFRVHRVLFERKIAKLFFRYSTRIECNKNKLYLILSKLFTKLSFKKIYRNWDGWGYCFIIARRN